MKETKTKKLTMLAMLTALAFILTLLCRLSLFSAAPFLTYDPKDVIIVISGFLFGPLAALAVSVVVSLLEMTISQSGLIGMLMNVLATVGFACTASIIYKCKRTIGGAVLGLIVGCFTMTALMLLWNYLISPLYMGVSRDVVAQMLLPVFLPFNLIKAVINTALALLLYKPLVTALRKLRLVDTSSVGTKANVSTTVIVSVFAVILLASAVLVLLKLNGMI